MSLDVADPKSLAEYKNSAVGHGAESRNDDIFNYLASQPNVDRISSKAVKLLLAKRIPFSPRKLPSANSGKMGTSQSTNYRNLL